MSTQNEIQVVVFDLGGVVVRICKTFDEAAKRAGVSIVPEALLEQASKEQRKAIHCEYEQGRLTCEDFFQRIAATTNGVYTPHQFRLTHEAWIIEEYPGIHELIDDLHRAGLQTGALSNTNASHWAQMNHLSEVAREGAADVSAGSMRARFDAPAKLRHRHASHLLGHAKPDAAIYNAFMQRTGFTAREIAFFDDLDANVDAARSAGWNAYRVDPDADPPMQIRRFLRIEHGVELG
jgi:putative hydrolase of the HAD superfamily